MNDFCDECGVSRDLHSYPDEPSPEDCEHAAWKADTLASFFGRVNG